MSKKDSGKLEIIAAKEFSIDENLVYVVDFLNKNLKNHKIMFGLNKDKVKRVMCLSIYEYE